MKIILFALSIVFANGVAQGVTLAGEDLAYKDYSYPVGSYQQQCRNCKVYWSKKESRAAGWSHYVKMLECGCKDKSNKVKVVDLDIKSCREVDVDEAGELHCARYATSESNECNASLLARVAALERKLAKFKSRLDNRAS